MSEKRIVLYVEDNRENRTLVRRVLEAEGYEVVEAANAEEALKKLQEKWPDIILMDISMPGVDGYSLTGTIKSLPDYSSTPIIAVTANVMRGDREKSLEAGCDGYIQKPIDIDLLAQQLERFLARQS